MYLIKHKKNCNYYKSKISNNMNHFVLNSSEAHKFKNKVQAQKILKQFNHQENFELVKI